MLHTHTHVYSVHIYIYIIILYIYIYVCVCAGRKMVFISQMRAKCLGSNPSSDHRHCTQCDSEKYRPCFRPFPSHIQTQSLTNMYAHNAIKELLPANWSDICWCVVCVQIKHQTHCWSQAHRVNIWRLRRLASSRISSALYIVDLLGQIYKETGQSNRLSITCLKQPKAQ